MAPVPANCGGVGVTETAQAHRELEFCDELEKGLFGPLTVGCYWEAHCWGSCPGRFCIGPWEEGHCYGPETTSICPLSGADQGFLRRRSIPRHPVWVGGWSHSCVCHGWARPPPRPHLALPCLLFFPWPFEFLDCVLFLSGHRLGKPITWKHSKEEWPYLWQTEQIMLLLLGTRAAKALASARASWSQAIISCLSLHIIMLYVVSTEGRWFMFKI